MPNIKSAKKRLKQSLVRRERNRSTKKAIRTECKKVIAAVKAGSVEQAETELRTGRQAVGQVGRQARDPSQRRGTDQIAAVGQDQDAQGQVASNRRSLSSVPAPRCATRRAMLRVRQLSLGEGVAGLFFRPRPKDLRSHVCALPG